MNRCTHRCAFVNFSALALAQCCQGDFVTFTDFGGWENAAGPFHTIDFTDFPHGTLVTDQYRDLGVLFTGPFDDDVIIESATFALDGFGLQAQSAVMSEFILEFDAPQFEFGVHFPSSILIEAFNDGEQVFIDDFFGGGFAGIVTDISFDSIRLASGGGSQANIDNIYFTIPAPGPIALLGISALVGTGRRRRDG